MRKIAEKNGKVMLFLRVRTPARLSCVALALLLRAAVTFFFFLVNNKTSQAKERQLSRKEIYHTSRHAEV